MKILATLLTFMCLLMVVSVNPSISQAQADQAYLIQEPVELFPDQGDEFTTTITLDAPGGEVLGTDIILSYVPEVVEVVDITLESVFDDYPLAAYDNQQGIISISGIKGDLNQLLQGRHQVATITWRLLQEQSSIISIQHNPGNTTDSNVVVLGGEGDALTSVTDVAVYPSGASNQTITQPQARGGLSVKDVAEKRAVAIDTTQVTGLNPNDGAAAAVDVEPDQFETSGDSIIGDPDAIEDLSKSGQTQTKVDESLMTQLWWLIGLPFVVILGVVAVLILRKNK